jgi:hypothetical protein
LHGLEAITYAMKYNSYKHNLTELEADNGEMNRDLAAYELKSKFAGSDE